VPGHGGEALAHPEPGVDGQADQVDQIGDGVDHGDRLALTGRPGPHVWHRQQADAHGRAEDDVHGETEKERGAQARRDVRGGVERAATSLPGRRPLGDRRHGDGRLQPAPGAGPVASGGHGDGQEPETETGGERRDEDPAIAGDHGEEHRHADGNGGRQPA
jgi:hypothetical protein